MHPISLLKATVLSIFILVFVSISAFSQAPNLLNYQGVARNTVGNPLPNQTMKLRLSVHDLLPSGAVVYSEIRQITTNLGGLFSVQIGSAGASSSTGTIAGVNWIVGNKFLQVELDPASNNNYLDIGTVQLVSVPYAFGAGTAATVKTNANLTGVVTSVGNATSIANGAITTEMIGTLNKSKVGLDLVNNTSDAAKPISTSTQGALDLKASAADVTTALGRKLAIADSTNGYVTPTQLAAKTFDTTSLSDRINLKANTSSLATVATSGSYNDLTNKPAVPAAYSLPTASTSSLGGIKVGSNLSIDDNGVLSGASSYSLPTASASQLGGVKVGTGLTITGGVLSASAAGVPYTGASQAVDLGAFDLKVNGITVGLGKNGINNNVAIGQSALSNTTSGFQGNYLTAVGYEALKTNTWGYFNTAIGSSSLFSNTTGLANTSIGSNSLLNNTTANFNTAVGTSALRNNTTGENNTASGASSLGNNTTGEQNSAFGRNALESNTTGSINTATGVGALSSNTAGGANTANGASALTSNIAGGGNTAMGNNALRNTNSSENTAIGNNAGVLNTTGTNNTAIGGYANFGANNLTNATALGYEATVSASNTIQLGNTSVTNVKTSGTLTTGTVTYPNTHGASGQVLSTTGSGTLTWTTASGGGSQWTSSSNDIYYSTGKVGIGTNSPSSNLHLVGAGASGDRNNMLRIESNNNASLTLKNTNANAGGGEYQLFTSSSNSNPSLGAGSLAIYYDHPSAAAYRFSINTAGNVGIGTGMPTEKLDVLGNVKTSGKLTAGTVTYPNTHGTSGQVLSTTGSGTLTWTTVSGGGSGVPYTGATGAVNLGAFDLTVNGLIVGKGNGNVSSNIAFGTGALSGNVSSSNLIGIGNNTLAGTLGVNNIAIGENAVLGGSYSIGIGKDALANNAYRGGSPQTDVGNRNIAIGDASLKNTGKINDNVSIGYQAMGNAGGYLKDNVAIGTKALYSFTGYHSDYIGGGNTAIGFNSAYSTYLGDKNTFIGYQSGYNNTNGNSNTSIGASTLLTNTTGTRNTAIGFGADVASGALTNAIAIGYGASVAADNTIQLGNTSVTNVKTSGTITAAGLEVTGNVTSTAGSISGFDAALNNQTGTTYTLTSSDNGKVVTLNNASPITLTINTGLGDGFNCLIVQKGAGQITMAGTATRINRQSHTKTAGQYAVVSIVNIGSETIIVAGDTGS